MNDIEYYTQLLSAIAEKMELTRGTDKYNKWADYYDETVMMAKLERVDLDF